MADSAEPEKEHSSAGGDNLRVEGMPILYLDGTTIIREVRDLSTLRRGDHCLIALNVFQSMSKWLDVFVGWLASWELFQLYHHFIILDDVGGIKDGIPVRSDGIPVTIGEFSDTIPRAYDRVLKVGVLPVILHKCTFHDRQLADYVQRDSNKIRMEHTHIFRVVEDITSAERERICKDALDMMSKAPEYNAFFQNCEHMINGVKSGKQASYQVVEVFGNVFRFILSLFAILFLYRHSCHSGDEPLDLTDSIAITDAAAQVDPFPSWVSLSHGHTCVWAVWALVGYHVFLSIPVGLHALINFTRAVLSIESKKASISTREYHHLLLKELCRAVFAGGGAIIVIALMPRMIWDTQLVTAACLIAVLAFHILNGVFNLCAQLSIRLIYGESITYPEMVPPPIPPKKNAGTEDLKPPSFNLYE